MSDVVVSTTASTTVVTTSSTAVNIAVSTYPVTVSASSVGLQGPTGANGAAGATGATGPQGPQGSAGAQGSAGVGYAGITSTSSITIGTGLKTWTVSSVGAFVPGMRIRAINTGSTTNWMEGPANVASGTTIIITVDKTAGSGTFSAWTFAATGEIGAQGNTGPQGTAGASGVISVTAPVTNTGSSSSAIIGLDQTQLSLTRSQISDFTSGTVAVATSATSANTALTAGTASYATTSGTAVFATNASTAVSVSGSAITKSQISDFTSGTVASAGTAQQAGTAVYSTSSGSALNAGTAVTISGSITKSQVSDFTSGTVAVSTSATSANTALTAGTATYATTSGTAVYATTSGTATYATTSGTAVNISGTVTASQVSGLPAIYASLGSANSFTLGPQTLNTGAATGLAVTVRGASGQTGDLQQWQTSASAVLGGVSPIGQIYSGSTNPLPAYYQSSAGQVTAITYVSATQATITNNNTSQVISVGSWVVIGGVGSNTTYNGTWLVTAIGGSSGAYTFTIQGSGFSNASTILTSATYNLAGAASFQSLNSQTPAIITRAATGQVANLIEAQAPGGTALLFRVASSGGVTAASLTSNGGVTISGASNPLTVGGTAGTSGQVLTSAGPGVSPAWSNVSVTPSAMFYGPRYLVAGYQYSPYPMDLSATYGGGIDSFTRTATSGQLTCIPFMVPANATAISLSAYVYTSVASSTARLGIYNNAGTADYPGSLLLDAGTFLTTTSGIKTITISQALSANTLYWLAYVQNNGLPTIYCSPYQVFSPFMPTGSTAQIATGYSYSGWSQSAVTSSMPASFTATKTGNTQAPMVWIGF